VNSPVVRRNTQPGPFWGTYEGLDLYDTAADLAACAPFVIDLDDVAVHFLHTRPPPQAHLGFALNGAVVGLAQRCPAACDQECGAAHPPACVGVGLIRAFDGARRQIYLLTPTPEEVLHSVTCLLVGKAAAFELPPSLLQAGPLDCASPYLGLWSLPGVTGATADGDLMSLLARLDGVAKSLICPRKGNASAPSLPHRVQPVSRKAWRKARCRECASGSGQQVQGQGQAVKVVIAERRQVIKAAFRGLVEAAQPDFSPEEVDAVVAQANQRMTMGSMQCCLAAVMSLTMLLQCFLGKPTPGFPAAGPAPCPPPPPDPACPPYSHPRLPTRHSPRSAAPPAQLPPPVQLDVEDPSLLPQIKAAMDLLTNATVQEHLMRGPHHSRIRLLPGEVAVFEQPSSAWPVAKLQELDQVHLQGDNNSLNANATKITTSITEFYRHPQRFINTWAKAVGVVGGGFSKEAKKHFLKLVLGRLDYSQPDREHKWRLPPNSVLREEGWREEVVWHRGLLGLPAEWEAGVESIGKGGAGWLPIENRVRYVLFLNRCLESWQIAPHARPHGNSRRRRTCPLPFTMLPMVGVRARHFVIDDRVLRGLLADLGQDTLTRARFEADSLPHWQRFIQYSQLQNSGWDFARRVETDGVSISVHFVRSQAVHEPVELPFIGRELTATSDYSPDTHIAVGVDPGVTQAIKAAHAQRDLATSQVVRQWEWELTKGQLKHDSGLTKAKQDTARWSAAIQPQLQQLAAATPAGTTLDALHAHILALKATWDPLWEEYLKPRWRRQRVVEQPSRPSTEPRPDRLVIVDEFRTSRRIGESKQRPLELCSWTDLRALPPVGKEYQQRYKLVNDRLPQGGISPQERAIDLGFVLIKGATEDATTCL
ncbi:hypothetical protein QJQ45_027576, partial [Haematococcus lacustris]